MVATDGEIVVMSYRRYRELCRTIDKLMAQLKAPVEMGSK